MSVSNATMRSSSSPWIDLSVAALAIGAIVGATFAAPGEIDGWRWLHWACKPLATLVVLALAWRAAPAVSSRYRNLLSAGIVLSLIGDIFLMLPMDAFVPGLVAFLLAHLCFLAALLVDSRFGERPWGLLACLAYGAFNLWALWPSLPGVLHAPVMVYVLVLSCMGGQSVVRFRRHHMDALASSAQWSMVGALLFMLSDTLLAWNRFRFVMPLSALWVLATYYAALWCLARSVRRGD